MEIAIPLTVIGGMREVVVMSKRVIRNFDVASL